MTLFHFIQPLVETHIAARMRWYEGFGSGGSVSRGRGPLRPADGASGTPARVLAGRASFNIQFNPLPQT